MQESLKTAPVGERPVIPIFPPGAVYFRRWQTLRWFLVLCLPILSSAVALWLGGRGIGTPLFLGFFGAGVCAWLFVSFCSGMISSSWGTHFRSSEPTGYWTQIVVGASAYIGLSLAGYFL